MLYLHRQHVRGVETGVDGEQALQTSQQQSGADQQHERERHLGDDQRAAGAPMAAGGARVSSAARPLADRRATRAAQGSAPTRMPMTLVITRPNTKTEASTRIAPTARQPRRAEGDQRADAGLRDEHAERAADQREQQALGEHLAVSRERPAPSAARIANSPRRCAPRASSRFVTLTHAIASTRSTAPSTASSAGRTPG